MNIGIDLDDTLINLNIVKLTSKEFKFNLNEVKYFDWEMSQFPKELREEIIRRFTDPRFMCEEPYISFIPNVKNKLDELKQNNHKLILITARNKIIRKETKQLINKVYPNFDKIHIVTRGQSKLSLFKKEKLDVWVDDHLENCKRALRLGIKVYMISNNSTPYNHNMKKHRNLKIIEKFTDIDIC